MSNKQKVKSSEQKVTDKEQKVTSKEQKVTSNEQKVTSNEQRAKYFTSLKLAINFYKTPFLPGIRQNKKRLSKQVVPIKYKKWRKGFLRSLLLKFCGSFLFRQSEKTCIILFSIILESSLDF